MKGVNHRAKRKGRFKARFTEGSDSAAGRAGGRALDRQGRKSNRFSARKGCAEEPHRLSQPGRSASGGMPISSRAAPSWRRQTLKSQ